MLALGGRSEARETLRWMVYFYLMSQGVKGGALVYFGRIGGSFELSLPRIFVQVMAGNFSGPWMGADFCGGKKVLPAEFSRSVAEFAAQRFRHMHLALADGEVLFVLSFQFFEMTLKLGFQPFR
jgi:hypothetical protein